MAVLIDRLCRYDVNNEDFWMINKYKVSDVTACFMKRVSVYKGHVFLEVYLEVGRSACNYMVVATVSGAFVGSVARVDSVSTPELSNLILCTPEISWRCKY